MVKRLLLEIIQIAWAQANRKSGKEKKWKEKGISIDSSGFSLAHHDWFNQIRETYTQPMASCPDAQLGSECFF